MGKRNLSPQMINSFFQTLPVGSVVFSVLATDPDTGSAGVVKYYIEKVSESLREWFLRVYNLIAPYGHQGAASPRPTNLQGPKNQQC